MKIVIYLVLEDSKSENRCYDLKIINLNIFFVLSMMSILLPNAFLGQYDAPCGAIHNISAMDYIS